MWRYWVALVALLVGLALILVLTLSLSAHAATPYQVWPCPH